MSAPVFAAHLRVPRGLGAVVEGLAREVLRDQPENIPVYAASYFNALLQQREECGVDPAEWAAKLEDRYHHNNLDLTDVAEKKSAPEMTRSADGIEDSQIKVESSAPLTEHIIASEKLLLSQSSDEESLISLIQSDEQSGSEEDDRMTLNSPDAETAKADLKSTSLSSLTETSNVELVERRDDLQGSPLPPNSLLDLEAEEVAADSEENRLNSGLADVEIAELHGTKESCESDMHVSEEAKSAEFDLEVADEQLFFPQNEIVQGNQEETQQAQSADDDAAASDSLIQMDIPKEDSLAELSSVAMEESDGKTFAKNTQMNLLESQQTEESTVGLADQNASDAEDQSKSEMNQPEREINSEILKEDMDRNNSDLNDSDDGEKDKGVKSIRASDQPTTEAENDIQVDEADRKNEEEMCEGQNKQSQETENEQQSLSKEDEGTDTGSGEEEEMQGKGEVEVKDGKEDLHPSQLTQLNGSMAGMEAESETCEESGCLSPQEKSQNATVESQQENTLEEVEKIPTSNLLMTEIHGGRSTEDENNPSEPTSNKEECSRPQEEEDIMDIPLDDPEANRAAAKIQAGFRGHMTRKKLKPEDKTEGEERQEDRGQ